jgi:hypothetical protein
VVIVVLCAILLAGEPVRFDADLQPRYSANQLRLTTESTREGLARWSSTAQGRALAARFDSREFVVEVIEDRTEEGVGRAIEPGLATFIAAANRSASKSYRVVLNPAIAAQKVLHVPGYPATAGDMMAVAFAAELLHVSFYARGIQLPHHERDDFQKEWRAVAGQLGYPRLRHGSDE